MPARREIPDDFHEHATEPMTELIRRYGAARHILARWRRELGIHVPPGAPPGNQNSVGNRSHQKETHGIDDIETVRICLACTAKKCSGQCKKVH